VIEGLRRLLWIYPSLRDAYRRVIQVRLVIGSLKNEGSGIRFTLYPCFKRLTLSIPWSRDSLVSTASELRAVLRRIQGSTAPRPSLG